ncbi:MAG: type II toxin-antitoxin system VapC family toxin [Deltaproteobacteria bacterium]|nr:type II toxin-antitoxin system VapC family toxin [Deltaproteobacteria bacterium]
MIVLDASAAVELVLGSRRGVTVAARLRDPAVTLHAPHLLDLEVAQVLRRGERDGWLAPRRAAEALADLRDLDVIRYPHHALLARVWELRHNVTAYDAAYLALAEALDAPILSCDARLASAPGHRARVELVG